MQLRVLATLLTEMDGVETAKDVVCAIVSDSAPVLEALSCRCCQARQTHSFATFILTISDARPLMIMEVVIGATNRPDLIDKALLRCGHSHSHGLEWPK